jgi:hypothetical protein
MNEEIRKKEAEIKNQQRCNLKYSKSRWYNSGITTLERLQKELEELKKLFLNDSEAK